MRSGENDISNLNDAKLNNISFHLQQKHNEPNSLP